jgi:ubiquinone/menaquinone biosynthesis C-methylase UbiE
MRSRRYPAPPLLPERPAEGETRPEAAAELERTYRGYRRSRRKQRSWSATNPGNIAIRTEVLAAILGIGFDPPQRGGDILDVGCGTGWLLGELARNTDPIRLSGVDLIAARVEAARSRIPEADVRLADARELPYENGRFEIVILLTTLSSMPDEDSVRRALKEAARVSSSTGIVICYEPRLPNPFNRSTLRISEASLAESLGPAITARAVTGFPPVARRLGSFTDRVYPVLASIAPTHRLSVHEPGTARRRHG